MGKTYLAMKGAAGHNGHLLTGSDLLPNLLDILVPTSPQGTPMVRYKGAKYYRIEGTWRDECKVTVNEQLSKFLELKFNVGECTYVT